MLYFDISQKTKIVVDEIEKSTNARQCLTRATNVYQSLSTSLSKYYSDSRTSHLIRPEAIVSETKAAIQNISSRAIFRELDNIVMAINNNIPELSILLEQIHSFINKYEQYIHEQQPAQTVEMLFQASELISTINGFKNGANLYKVNEIAQSENCSEAALLVVLSSNIELLSQLNKKLNSIQEIYSELCILFKVSETDYPAKIVKVESGSLLVKILGSAAVISIITDFLTSGAGFLYRNYTAEGKIEANKKNTEYLITAAELSSKLRAHGIDSKDLDENIKKSAAVLSKNFNDLISDQNVLLLNNIELPVGGNQLPKLLEADHASPKN